MSTKLKFLIYDGQWLRVKYSRGSPLKESFPTEMYLLSRNLFWKLKTKITSKYFQLLVGINLSVVITNIWQDSWKLLLKWFAPHGTYKVSWVSIVTEHICNCPKVSIKNSRINHFHHLLDTNTLSIILYKNESHSKDPNRVTSSPLFCCLSYSRPKQWLKKTRISLFSVPVPDTFVKLLRSLRISENFCQK